MISTKIRKSPHFRRCKKWENCKENKGHNKVQTRSQDNTLTILFYYMV